MSMNSHVRFSMRAALMGGAAALLAPAAHAQSSAAQPADDGANAVVVTGTLIRGVAPVGTAVVSVGREQIEQAGVASANNLLASLPQLANFNSIAATATNLGNNTARPNVRGLAPGTFAPTTTLLLLDGHNMVGSGILQTSPDPTLIPTGAIERVEVVADGGSSLYGSDAVAGIINFITRKRFDGTLVEAHAGFADEYKSNDVNITNGQNWDSGSWVVSAMRRENTSLLTENRDRPRQNLIPLGGTVDGRVRTCNPATVTVGTTSYALARTPVFTGLTPGSFNLCDATADGSIAPEERQTSVFTSLTQSVTDMIEFNVTGYWSNRLTETPARMVSTGNLQINSTNPFFRTINGGAETSQLVSFSYADAAGRRFENTSENTSYGFTPSLTFELGGGWQAKAMYNYGYSDVRLHLPIKNAAAEIAAVRAAPGTTLTTATALNPYDVRQTEPSVIAHILNFETYARNEQVISQERVSVGGPIMTLPGGDVRVELGAQHSYESIDALQNNAPPNVLSGPAFLRKAVDKNVKSAFAEVFVPIVGPDNAMPMVRSLAVDVSGRYDHYSDFGDTTNPKLGVTYEPFAGLSVRGSVGTSFNAPALPDTSGAVDERILQTTTGTNDLAPGANRTVDLQRPILAVTGGNPALRPQTADTLSAGIDVRPTQIPGLSASLTYWSAKLQSTIGTSDFARNTLYNTPAYSQYYILYPTLAQATAAFGGGNDLKPVTNGTTLANAYSGPPQTWPYLLLDWRRNNLGNQNANGLDFQASYRREFDFGAISARVSGTKLLERKNEPFPGAPLVDLLAVNTSTLQVQGSIAVELGKLFASATMNYSQGYDVTNVVNQTKVDAFHPVDLFFRYDLQGESGISRDLSLTLNVRNVGDITPPFINSGGGTANGSTLGRLFNLGVSKRF